MQNKKIIPVPRKKMIYTAVPEPLYEIARAKIHDILSWYIATFPSPSAPCPDVSFHRQQPDAHWFHVTLDWETYERLVNIIAICKPERGVRKTSWRSILTSIIQYYLDYIASTEGHAAVSH